MDIYILFGQTATGKTAKALELVEKHTGEIVNFDSRQIYKKLTIITGKDIPKGSKFKAQSLKQEKYNIGYYELLALGFQPSAKIWLYDIIDPKQTFSSAEYVALAEEAIKDIIDRGKTPILVGGTGYYLRHLIYGIPEMKTPEDWTLRKELEIQTVGELQEILKKKNGQMLADMNNSDRNNPRRLIRRIEIANSGEEMLAVSPHETLSERLGNLAGCKQDITLTYLPFFHASTDSVREKIAQRVDQRIADGAFQEVEDLLTEGYIAEDPGLNAIGYQQIIAYHKNKLSLAETKKQWITKEVQYAKRQKTYFNKYFA